jgi:hypothetical protein
VWSDFLRRIWRRLCVIRAVVGVIVCECCFGPLVCCVALLGVVVDGEGGWRAGVVWDDAGGFCGAVVVGEGWEVFGLVVWGWELTCLTGIGRHGAPGVSLR